MNLDPSLLIETTNQIVNVSTAGFFIGVSGLFGTGFLAALEYIKARGAVMGLIASAAVLIGTPIIATIAKEEVRTDATAWLQEEYQLTLNEDPTVDSSANATFLRSQLVTAQDAEGNNHSIRLTPYEGTLPASINGEPSEGRNFAYLIDAETGEPYQPEETD